MQRLMTLSLLLLPFGNAVSVRSEAQLTPIQKVVQMMENMKAKGTQDMEAEQVQYSKFKEFCSFTLGEKTKSINEANDRISILAADAQKADSDALSLANEVEVHIADAAKAAKDLEQAAAQRQAERSTFDLALKDYTESVDAVRAAIKTLKEQDVTKKQAAPSLMQLASAKFIPEDTQRSINALLMEAVAEGRVAPEAHGYDFQSGGVVDMLKDLQEQFVNQRTDLENAEASKRRAYELLAQALERAQAASKKDSDEKTRFKAQRLQAKVDAETNLKEMKSARDADVSYGNDLSATCDQKASDFKERQRVRKEEIGAIAKAIEIISSDTVSGAAKSYLPKFVQTSATSLAALRSRREPSADVAAFLQSEAATLKSAVLAKIASKLSAPDLSAVGDVTALIKKLLDNLTKQGQDEANQKEYCDREMSTNNKTRMAKATHMAELKAQIDQTTSAISLLEKDVSDATASIAELSGAMANATALRTQEKEKNARTIKDAQDASKAVAAALTIVKEFYAKSAAPSFLQTEDEIEATPAGAPEIFTGAYTGMSSASGGVVGLLEVIQSDFARLEAETTSAEAIAAKEYDQFIVDTKKDKAAKDEEVQDKLAKKAQLSQTLSSLDADQQGTQKELDAALAYFEKLKPSCVDAEISFAEKAAKREQEIKDLEVALERLGA